MYVYLFFEDVIHIHVWIWSNPLPTFPTNPTIRPDHSSLLASCPLFIILYLFFFYVRCVSLLLPICARVWDYPLGPGEPINVHSPKEKWLSLHVSTHCQWFFSTLNGNLSMHWSLLQEEASRTKDGQAPTYGYKHKYWENSMTRKPLRTTSAVSPLELLSALVMDLTMFKVQGINSFLWSWSQINSRKWLVTP